MMARRYLYKTVTGTASTEVLQTLLTSTEVEPKRVIKIYPYETTSTRQGDAVIRLYVEREKIAEFPIYIFQNDLSNKQYMNVPVIELNLELPVGQSLIVGVVSGTTASNFAFMIEYEVPE